MTLKPARNTASLLSRIDTLRRRHRRLDLRVETEQRRPRPDAGMLQWLKRERLRLKDQLRAHEGRLRKWSRDRAAT
ncbi:DUF465 domain-containing protein [Amaricoccus macauensis]|uniref:DUF465 domain-containing protein n=1 Tax=Amaricoccus macauensis TaxID=57001 RepID=UPI003C7D44D7